MTAHRLRRVRRGFTLVEVMVACALVIVIMTIITTAFTVVLGTTGQLKAVSGEMDELRTVERLLRSDLEAPHFADRDPDAGDPDKRSDSPAYLRLSDLRYDQSPAPFTPKGGFVRFEQIGPSETEGNDQDGLVSTHTRADGSKGHVIDLTVRRLGRSAAELHTVANAGVAVPGSWTDADPSAAAAATNGYVSDWAQVRWALDPTTSLAINGVPTFALRRSVRVLARTSAGNVSGADNTQMSVSPATGKVNTVFDVATATNRPTIAPLPATDPRAGDDVVLTNVVSFEVKLAYSPATPTGTSEAPYHDLPAAAGGGTSAFDTSAPTTLAARVVAAQVKVRVYDAKAKQTRQTSIRIKL